MKVTLVSSGSGSRGGGEIYLALLAEGLSRLDCDVTALVPSAAAMDELVERLARHAQIIRFPFRPTYERKLRNLSASLDRSQRESLAARFCSLDTDVLHINQQVAEDGLDILQAAALSQRSWVSTIHVGRSAASLGARFGALRDGIARHALRRTGGQHIVVCAAAQNQLAARFGHGGPDLHVVHNGVQVPEQTDLAAARVTARRDWGVAPNEVVVGTVGRIEDQKNPMALVNYLHPLGQRVRAVWVGDGTLRDALERHAATTGVALVIDGWRADASLRLAGLDIFILPSKYEGLPLALLEAMHAGLPIVASHTDGTGEAISHGESGFLCSTRDEWHSALRQLAEDAELRARLGAAAREVALTRFSTDAMATATLAVYQRLRPSAARG